MKLPIANNPQQADRNGERGAALLTTLLISMLVLAAGMALVTSTSLSTTTSIDAAAEMQAYSAAEAGLDATLNVIRGNIAPHSSLAGTTMNFRTAAHPALSNKTSDSWATGTSAKSRMSGWLNYSYQNGSDWRVPLTADYSPRTGIAYKIDISDPDDVGPIASRKITTQASYVPTRILVRAEGYGPKGAVKRLEMIVTSAGADIRTPGAITMAGGPINLDLGNSAVVSYTGNDMGSPAQSPVAAVAVTSGQQAAAQTVINGMKDASQVQPNTPAIISPTNSAGFLQSADAARSFLNTMKLTASGLGRLFSTQAAAAASTGGLGTTTSPKMTVIDNYSGPAADIGNGHAGSGLLIVTGDLETHGNTSFEGIILVLGKGNVSRSGGGNGLIRGTIMIANFDPNGAFGTGFGTPSFSINGGGNSTVGYDSAWIRRALDVLGIAIVGVREYH